MRYLLSALPAGALPIREFTLRGRWWTLADARRWVSRGVWVSAIGHASTAQVVGNLLGTSIPAFRVVVALEPGDEALVCVLPARLRLAEGQVLTAKELEALDLRWLLVGVSS